MLCGKTEQIGQGAIATPKAKYDSSWNILQSYNTPLSPGLCPMLRTQANMYAIIPFVMSPGSGAIYIAAILKGEQSLLSGPALYNKGYSRPPVLAVILGGAFDDAGKLTKPTPSLGTKYGKAMVAQIKVLLVTLKKKGKMNEEKVH
ncbi:hypothetical protein F5Y12DRAFT_424892 [Xylaria sp. FL1777]|nr:hypothetical protein F5Y12DRAFT_424892 [Xylaria sp. FL1777]